MCRPQHPPAGSILITFRRPCRRAASTPLAGDAADLDGADAVSARSLTESYWRFLEARAILCRADAEQVAED